MSEKDNKDLEGNLTDEAVGEVPESEASVRKFNLADRTAENVSSAELIADDKWVIADDMEEILEVGSADEVSEKAEETTDGEKEEEKRSPIFKKLAEPKLPQLPKENRARLQMQSPTRLYFYWSVKNNPFQTLNKAFGGRTGSYTFVTKLINKTKGTEELFSVEPEGNWWFNVDADADYVAELGFYAPNRPFVRVMFSNEIHTPRKSPSKRRDYTPSFNVNAYQFAEVLDVAGYQRDAFEVAFAGDDEIQADQATQKTYNQLFGENTETFKVADGDEIRFVLLALASGYSLEDIRNEINPSLYAELQREIAKLSSEEVLAALKENFDITTDELFEEEEIGEAVFGASLVNFPKRIRKRSVPKSLSPKDGKFPKLSKFSPVSSAEFPISS
jgi:hypothetical protein